MRKHLIGYDLRRPGKNYDSLIEAIKSYGAYYHVLDSTWLITTSKAAAQVRDHLSQHLDANDSLVVVGLTGETAWHNLPANGENWLRTEMAA